MSPRLQPDDRLKGYPAIADYLGVSVKTVQRLANNPNRPEKLRLHLMRFGQRTVHCEVREADRLLRAIKGWDSEKERAA